jgi:hemolysin III
MAGGGSMTGWLPRRADAAVQGVNLVLAVAGSIVLLAAPGLHTDSRRVVAFALYAAGLVAMTGCSTLYAWGRYGPRRAVYRRLDKAAIFLMIGGTYTPLILIGGGETHGLTLLAAIWSLALAGAVVTLTVPHRLERLSVPLYLLLGWAVVSDPGLLARLPMPVVALLVAGGCLYSVGVVFHRARLAFQEAIWHGFVLAGAACHYAAIVLASRITAVS